MKDIVGESLAKGMEGIMDIARLKHHYYDLKQICKPCEGLISRFARYKGAFYRLDDIPIEYLICEEDESVTCQMWARVRKDVKHWPDDKELDEIAYRQGTILELTSRECEEFEDHYIKIKQDEQND